MKSFWISLFFCIGSMVFVGRADDFSVKSSGDDTQGPMFLASTPKISISAIFLVCEEWVAINWDELMDERGVAQDKRETLKTLISATCGYKTGDVSSNIYTLVYFVRDEGAFEMVCFKKISEETAESLRNGGANPTLQDMDRAWRSADKKLMGKAKNGEWVWLESARPIPDFAVLITGVNCVPEDDKKRMNSNPDSFRSKLDGGMSLWVWENKDDPAPRVKYTLMTDAKGRMREFNLFFGNSLAEQTTMQGLDVPGKEFGQYKQEEYLPTADGKKWVHHRNTFECLSSPVNVQEMYGFIEGVEKVAVDAPEDFE